MAEDKPIRRHLNAAQKRALKTADMEKFLQATGRPSRARNGHDPNDRHFDPDTAKTFRRMDPQKLGPRLIKSTKR
jgi:hypothetical protein